MNVLNRPSLNRPSVPESYFAEMYRADADPWHLAERWYEQRKYALTLASLPARRYRRAFEPGCSVGVLSELLAPRCERLLSWDRRPEAVEAAARRLATFPGAQAVRGVVPEQWPDGEFDLIVLSELLYYLDVEERAWLLKAAMRSLPDGGHLVAVHWRHHIPEHAAEADEVHADLRALPELQLLSRHEEEGFLLDVFVRIRNSDSDGVVRRNLSVAALEGLV
jgi:SAM-dependent methyltransferase